ncbi:MAG: PQQ-binding-like beta-propeller repeat protein [Planctomycetaceae bacterium]
MNTQLLRSFTIRLGLVGLVLFSISALQGEEASSYPFSDDLKTLANDLENEGYQQIVAKMIRNDLEEEWKRVATSDNYIRFRNQHGGIEKINQDPELKAAYAKRKEVADQYLQLMDNAYAALNKESQVLRGELLEAFLAEPPALTAEATVQNKVKVAPYLVVDETLLGKVWPQFRGPDGQGDVLKSRLPLVWSTTENVLWTQPVTGTGHSSPVIWEDQLFLTIASEDGLTRELVCYNAHTGEPLWQQKVAPPESTEKLYWKNSYASSTPVTDGKRVVVFLGNSGLTSFTMEGQQEWHQPLETFEIMHGPATSPIIYRDLVILIQDQNKGDSLFVAYDKRTGKQVYRQPREQNPGGRAQHFSL